MAAAELQGNDMNTIRMGKTGGDDGKKRDSLNNGLYFSGFARGKHGPLAGADNAQQRHEGIAIQKD